MCWSASLASNPRPATTVISCYILTVKITQQLTVIFHMRSLAIKTLEHVPRFWNRFLPTASGMARKSLGPNAAIFQKTVTSTESIRTLNIAKYIHYYLASVSVYIWAISVPNLRPLATRHTHTHTHTRASKRGIPLLCVNWACMSHLSAMLDNTEQSFVHHSLWIKYTHVHKCAFSDKTSSLVQTLISELSIGQEISDWIPHWQCLM